MVKRLSWILLVGVLLTLAVVVPAAAQSEGQVGGIVYNDKNGNGIREEGEVGVGNVEVIFDSGGWNTAIATADNGAFSIALNPGTWTVTVTAPDEYDAPNNTATALIQNPGDAVTNLEFALVPKPGTAAAGTDEDGNPLSVLPASGGIVSSEIMIGGLVGVMLIGVALVIIGQRQKNSNS